MTQLKRNGYDIWSERTITANARKSRWSIPKVATIKQCSSAKCCVHQCNVKLMSILYEYNWIIIPWEEEFFHWIFNLWSG